MRRIVPGIVLLLFILPAAALRAQRIQFAVPPSVAAKAIESVDVTPDGPLMAVAAKFFSPHGDDPALRTTVQQLAGNYANSYKFAEDPAYARSSAHRLRHQLGPACKPRV